MLNYDSEKEEDERPFYSKQRMNFVPVGKLSSPRGQIHAQQPIYPVREIDGGLKHQERLKKLRAIE